MNKEDQYKKQRKYFDAEFSQVEEYSLAQWQISYIEKMKEYMLDKNYKEKTLIDIATGRGYIAIEMAKLGLKKVIASDLSPEAIKNLQKYKKQFKLKNLELIVCPAEKIPLKDNSVDYIVANAILEHIPEEKEAILEWKRILKKKGRMLITVPLKFKYVWPFLWPVNKWHDKRIGHLRRYDLIDLKQKFDLSFIQYFYTGHLIKVLGILLSILTKSAKYDVMIERADDRKRHMRYGANNISVIFKNE